ncbi:GNAT family N-acetyltransferase [Catellatospora sp. KI3]|uniref:GNAT family N-acetyltransferase n=1 Tax=Catellatospora sp. KI3 TaxID=3041620 RepID=UPI002482CB2B|nr:GNAT family N-acetyltransferase [Catellatospora sp. KI3]MDI1461622.1 GNAT family N-acetyltransferase [Catellatospora sp. KI3]
MRDGTSPVWRTADPDDAEAVANLHADSWRRHYRGAFADAFLDGDVLADRRAVWTARLAAPGRGVTILARDGAGLAGFVHVVLDEDDRWGSFVDNLHVVADRHRTGLGTGLMARAARTVLASAATPALYLWVLEQNTAAQGFYRAVGGTAAERAPVGPPGGVPGRLHGTPAKLRFTWPDVARLAARPDPPGGR